MYPAWPHEQRLDPFSLFASDKLMFLEVFTAADPNGLALSLQQKWPHILPHL